MDSNKAIEKTISLYTNVGWKRWFSKIRFWDAPYLLVESLVPKEGYIVDIGCGEGIFTNFLAVSSSKRKVLGIDLNKQRIEQANQGVKNTSFKHGNALTTHIPKTDCIVLFHLLHHLPSRESQEKLIEAASKNIKRNGSLIIAEVTYRPTWKYILSWLTDAFVVPILFEKRAYDFGFIYRQESEWKKLLIKNGFKVKSKKAHRGMPFSHIVFVAKKV